MDDFEDDYEDENHNDDVDEVDNYNALQWYSWSGLQCVEVWMTLPSWCALQNWLKHSNTMYHNNDDNDDDDDDDDGPQRMQRNHALRT